MYCLRHNLTLHSHLGEGELAEQVYLGYNLRRPGRVAQLVRVHGSHP
jgi:hypothetical protein